MPTQLTIKQAFARPKSGRKAKKKVIKSRSTGLNTTERKQVKGIIAARKELKYCPTWINYAHYDPANYTPNQLPPLSSNVILPNVYDAANGVVSIVGLQTGQYLNSVSQQLDNALTAAGQGPCMYPVGGYGMERGDDSTVIDGNEVYFNAGKMNLQINAVVAEGNGSAVNQAVGPLCFRVLHVKAKQDAAGVSPSTTGALFRNMINDNAGFTSFMTQRELFHDYSINRQRFHVLSDKKFKLSQPVQPGFGGNSVNQPVRNYAYPSQKNITLYLDKPKKKLRMNVGDDGLKNAFEPLNYDFVHYVFVLCCREQINSSQFSNTGKTWTLTSIGQSTYREA